MTKDDGRIKFVKHEVNKKFKNGRLKMGITLKDTVELMNSEDWKERLKAEYFQTKIRWNKLRLYYSEIKDKQASAPPDFHYTEEASLQRTEIDVIERQIDVMDEYLLMLEMRAGIHGIDLEGDDI